MISMSIQLKMGRTTKSNVALKKWASVRLDNSSRILPAATPVLSNQVILHRKVPPVLLGKARRRLVEMERQSTGENQERQKTEGLGAAIQE